MSPIIGITPLWDLEKESLWMLSAYTDAIRQSGGLPVILPFDIDDRQAAQLADRCDGFLFTGGQDVAPDSRAGQKEEAEGTYAPSAADRIL